MSEAPGNMHHMLKLHPIDGEFIGTINLETLPQSASNSACPTIIILDQSGSMGGNVKYIVNKILPAFFTKLNYKKEEEIHLITFADKSLYKCIPIKDLAKMKVQADGNTLMSNVFKYLRALMESFRLEKVAAVRVLTISDGEIFDQKETKALSSDVASLAKKLDVSINSQAVRFFSSLEGEPDTTALCCLLQLNNVTTSNLLDTQCDEKFETIVDKWAALFADDGLMNIVEMKCDSKVLRKNPWDEENVDKIRLVKGQNVFWVSEVPKNGRINKKDVQMIVVPPMNHDQFCDVINETLDIIIDQMRILKIIETKDGRETMTKMVEYFKRIEDNFIADDATQEPEDDCKISTLLDAIAKDENISKLSPSAKADYLRSAKKPQNFCTPKKPKVEVKDEQKEKAEQELDWQTRKESLQLLKVDQKERALIAYSKFSLFDCVKKDSPQDVETAKADDKFDWELLFLTIVHRTLRFVRNGMVAAGITGRR